MKHLLLILSLTLFAGLANAGTSMSNNDCPYADKANASSLYQSTAAVKTRSQETTNALRKSLDAAKKRNNGSHSN